MIDSGTVSTVKEIAERQASEIDRLMLLKVADVLHSMNMASYQCGIQAEELRKMRWGANEDGLYQCPYESACKCRMDERCEGCETWSQATQHSPQLPTERGDRSDTTSG